MNPVASLRLLLLLVGLMGLTIDVDGSINFKVGKPDDFEIYDRERFPKMRNDFIAINRALLKRLPRSQDADANFKASREIQDRSGNLNLSVRVALSLLNHVPDVIGFCTLDSADTFARNLLAAGESSETKRIVQMVKEFHRRHANICRPKFRSEFIARMLANQSNLNRVRAALSTVQADNVIRRMTKREAENNLPDSILIIKEPVLYLQGDARQPATEMIARQISAMLEQAGQWDRVLQLTDRPDAYEQLMRVVNEYILEPCEKYIQSDGEFLAAARYEATVEDEKQYAYLMEDEAFARALVDYRICNLLVRKSEKAGKKIAAELFVVLMRKLDQKGSMNEDN